MIFYITIVFLLFYVFIMLVYGYKLIYFKKDVYLNEASEFLISILVAARNEEENILDCLIALNLLDYDKNKMEILIGNDDSTDKTQSIIESFIKDKPQFKLINIKNDEPSNTKGKARVLAILAAKGKGDIFLITDADIKVNENWANGMVQYFKSDKIAMIGATTSIKSDVFLGFIQKLDWMYFMGIINVLDKINRPITMVGNNMAFTKKAYEEIGGYNAIPFSITEDYALFHAFRKKGLKTKQILNLETLSFSKPAITFRAILTQRKRWLQGGLSMPLFFKILIFVFSLWYFFLPVLFFFNWKLALLLFVFKNFIQLLQLHKLFQLIQAKAPSILLGVCFEIYLFLVIPLTGLSLFLGGKSLWKGRRYSMLIK